MVEIGSSDLTVEDLREMYRLMLMGRRFTERTLELYEEGRLKPYHPSAGQEAVGVGACYGLRPSDWVIPSLRTTEAFWTRGLTMQENLNAMLGNSGSISSGKESFHHAGYPKLGILAGTALVAAQIPVAVGAALTLRMRRSDGVMVCFFGDGATARGDFHEGLNLAAILKVPVVFICENNLYFQTAPGAAGMAVDDVADRAVGYGMPGRVVDGQDVLAVYEATREAVERARRGEGPTLLECKTYRFLRHHPTQRDMRDPTERARWMERDPIKLLAQRLKDKSYIDDAVIQGMESAIKRELEDAIVKAEATPSADPKEALTNVYAEPLEAMRI
jgi:TPP-dependent pyruvate/acetoin dehydrogenase alpha subunit